MDTLGAPMAKTPMMRALLRALRSVRNASQAGIPLDEFLAMERESRLPSRRRFLELVAGASAASASLLAACDNDTQVSPAVGSVDGGGDVNLAPPADGGPDADAIFDAGVGERVVIVGAGMAGLHCAYRLKKLGITARVFDASKTAGGRIQSDRTTFADGMHCELGGELIDTDHATMHGLATELGIELLDYANDAAPDGGPLETCTAYIGGNKLGTADILAGFGAIAAAVDAANATIPNGVRYTDSGQNDAGATLDGMSIRQWLDSIGAAGPTRRFLEIAYTTEYGLDIEVSNCLNLIELIGTSTSALQLYGDSDERFHTKTGNSTFIEKLSAALDAGQVAYESRLVRLSKNSDGRYTLTFTRGSTTFDVVATHVVLAIPFSILRDVDLQIPLSTPKSRAIQELGYGQNTKLMVGFTSKPWRDGGASGEGFYELPIQSSWETSRLQPGASGIITCFTGAAEAIAAGTRDLTTQTSLFLDDWERVFPGSRAAHDGRALRGYWPGNPLTKGSYAAYLVGQYSAFSGAEIERAENVHFCGEHTSTDYQGFMEGAALTGAMAADEVARDLGVSEQGRRGRIRVPSRRELFVPRSAFG